MKHFSTKKGVTLYCFNPFVTLATGLIELVFACFACFKYRHTTFGRSAICLLLLLGVFQLSEYVICSGNDISIWNRIGYAAITFLPALGLYLTEIITKKSFWTPLAFFTATFIAAFILFLKKAFVATYCTGTFVFFDLNSVLHYFFGGYYFFFIFVALYKIAISLLRKQGDGTTLRWLLIGYLSFLMPSLIVTILFSSALNGIPSIMCGFAVLFAAIILFKVLPSYEASIKNRP